MARNEILFGRNLRTLRRQKGVSQQELADEIHMTRQALSAWERGAGKPDIYCVHDICKHLDVSIETLLYKNLSNEIDFRDYEELFEYGPYIKSISESGFYTIIDEDLEDFFEIIRHDMEYISVTALGLSKRGYTIIEVFKNGFSIYLKTDKEAIRFQRDLYDILENFIHHDNSYIEKKRKEVDDIIGTAYGQVRDNVMAEIYGSDIDSFAYCWMDEEENVRGYANTEEDCRSQAEFQKCADYTILYIAQKA